MNLLEIGKILRPHGVKGAVKVESYIDETFSFKNVLVGKDKQPATIKSVQHLNKDFYIITLNIIPDIDTAEKFRNQSIYIDRSEYSEFEDKVYFYTNNHTHAFKQIAVNPKIELCAPISEERWLRVSGKVVYDYRPEVKKAVLDAHPELRTMYHEDDKIFEVFYLSNMAATIHSVHSEPEVIC